MTNLAVVCEYNGVYGIEEDRWGGYSFLAVLAVLAISCCGKKQLIGLVPNM